MTADEFRTVTKSYRISQRWLADRLGVQASTVNRWANGHSPVPQHVDFCLVLIRRLAAHGISFGPPHFPRDF